MHTLTAPESQLKEQTTRVCIFYAFFVASSFSFHCLAVVVYFYILLFRLVLSSHFFFSCKKNEICLHCNSIYSLCRVCWCSSWAYFYTANTYGVYAKLFVWLAICQIQIHNFWACVWMALCNTEQSARDDTILKSGTEKMANWCKKVITKILLCVYVGKSLSHGECYLRRAWSARKLKIKKTIDSEQHRFSFSSCFLRRTFND